VRLDLTGTGAPAADVDFGSVGMVAFFKRIAADEFGASALYGVLAAAIGVAVIGAISVLH
jgi:Flp pilus assembly pilin Flp